MKKTSVHYLQSLFISLLILNAFASCLTRAKQSRAIGIDFNYTDVTGNYTTLAADTPTTLVPTPALTSTIATTAADVQRLDYYEKLLEEGQKKFGGLTQPIEYTTILPFIENATAPVIKKDNQINKESVGKNTALLRSRAKNNTVISESENKPHPVYTHKQNYELIINKCHPDVCTYKITCKCLVHTVILDGCGVELLETWRREGIKFNNECGTQIAKHSVQYNQPALFRFVVDQGLLFNPADQWFTKIQDAPYDNETKKYIFKHLISQQLSNLIGTSRLLAIVDFNKAFQKCFQTGGFINNKSLIELFITGGANINGPLLYPSFNRKHNLLIHYITNKEDRLDLDRIKFLIDNGADINKKIEVDGQEVTILHFLKTKLRAFQLLDGPFIRHIEPYKRLIALLASKDIKN